MAPRPGCLEEGLGEGVVVVGDEVAVEAVEGEEEGLAGLGEEGGDVPGVPDVLGGPEGSAAVTDVAHEAERRGRRRP